MGIKGKDKSAVEVFYTKDYHAVGFTIGPRTSTKESFTIGQLLVLLEVDLSVFDLYSTSSGRAFHFCRTLGPQKHRWFSRDRTLKRPNLWKPQTLDEPQSKLPKGGYIGDCIGDYYRGY